jgi:queuine tRNA-ribosyltransferase
MAGLAAPLPRTIGQQGVETRPLDLIESVALGVDMFDCVMPTRNGRNGSAFTSQGRLSIKNLQNKMDHGPIDPACNCYTCETFSRGYVRHLFNSGEVTALRLLSLHNLTFYLNFMKKIRKSIAAGTFETLLAEQRAIWDR